MTTIEGKQLTEEEKFQMQLMADRLRMQQQMQQRQQQQPQGGGGGGPNASMAMKFMPQGGGAGAGGAGAGGGGGAGAGAGAGGGGGGGGAMAAAGPWAALAAAVIANEYSAEKAGRRDSDSHLQDAFTGKVLEQDLSYYGDKVGGIGGKAIDIVGQAGHPEGQLGLIKKSLMPWKW